MEEEAKGFEVGAPEGAPEDYDPEEAEDGED